MRSWQNNNFNKRVFEEFPREFSLEDVDGVITFYYEGKVRLIIYEIKSVNERNPGMPQLLMLNLLRQSIDWRKFDDKSGVFIIRGLDENFNKTDINKLIGKENNQFIFEDIGVVDFNYYQDWFYGKPVVDNSNVARRFPCPKCSNLIEEYNDGSVNIPCSKCGWSPC